MRPVRVFAGVCGLLLVGAVALADKGRTEGTYTDSKGRLSQWSVNRSHALTWDGQLYAPAGVVFHSQYLLDPGAETLAADKTRLEKLKSAGVLDVWIDPGQGLLSCEADNVQQIVDLLEASQFRYGLAVQDRSSSSLVGYAPQLEPVSVPAAALQSGGRFQWAARVRGAKRVHFALVDAESDWVIAAGTAVVEDGIASIDVALRRSKALGQNKASLYILPEKVIPSDEAGSFPDLWGAMNDYEKKLVAYLKSLRFGPGLRFILDPFAAAGGVEGVETTVFPVSSEFRSAFGDWLSRNRLNTSDINLRWGFRQTHIDSMEVASRLVPTWRREDPPETGWLIDPIEKTAYQVSPIKSRIWDDYSSFRADSLRRCMNRVAATVKAAGPGVPVIYTWDGFHPLFAYQGLASNFDGMGTNLAGNASALAVNGAGPALAQAELSSQSWWLVATRVVPEKEVPGAPDLAESWGSLRDVGFKGVFVDFGVKEPGPGALEGLKQVGGLIADDRDLVSYRPKVCYYPAFLPNAGRVTRLPNGVWWLPSTAAARALQLGEKIAGYQIDYPFGDEQGTIRRGMILWSPTGKQQATFASDPIQPIALLDTEAKPIKFSSRQRPKMLKLDLTDVPLVAVGLDVDVVFPMEATSALIDEFEALLNEADANGLDTRSARQLHKDARSMLRPESAAHVYQLVTKPVSALRELISPYQWIEGERASEHNWTGAVFQTGSSGGRYLKLDRGTPPREGPYQSRYVVEVRHGATYEIWVAGTPPGRPSASPLRWSIDGDQAQVVTSASTVGEDYVPGITWFSLGRANLTKGRHILTLEAADRAPGGERRYSFAVDSIVLARAPFSPAGSQRPDWRATPKDAGAPLASQP